MTVRHQILAWSAVAIAASLLLVAIVRWRHATSEEFWSTFLAGDPHAGAHIFREKGCSHCHAVNGIGGKQAPDLGFQLVARSQMTELVTAMWNHAPRMWRQMEAEQLSYPSFSAREMANLFAYLYTARYVYEPGDAARGGMVFSEKGCTRCHSVDGQGGKLGPELTQIGPVDTPLFWSQAMWNHAPTMEAHMRQLRMDWPRFENGEMSDLLAFVREKRAGPQQEFELLPADPARGWALFKKKGCLTCHAIRGEGGTAAPDLGTGSSPRSTLTQLAALMWNHSPEMWHAMRAKGIERPTFEGKEMADLIAFLHSVRYFELAGSAVVGQELFTERGCARCHGADGRGAENGPKLRGRDRLVTTLSLAGGLWSHGPRMFKRARDLGLEWPTLQESDLGHLIAFLNSPPETQR